MTLDMITLDLVGLVVGAVLVLMVFSYVLGDNALFRLALHIFVGASVGYAMGLALRLILSRFIGPLVADRNPLWLIPVVLVAFLLLKCLPKVAHMGNLAIGYLLGVGVAVALSGALLGTIIPQAGATGRALSAYGTRDGLIILVGTLSTLAVFTFGARGQRGRGRIWAKVVGGAAWVGRWFLVVALALGFAGALTAALTILTTRAASIFELASTIAGLLGLAGG